MISRQEKNKKVLKEINREKTIKRSKTMLIFTFFCASLVVVLYLYIRFIGTSFLKTNEYIIRSNVIPASFHGIKIVHISDILYGSTINNNDLDNLKEEISLVNPDIIVFTGDLVFDKHSITQDEINYLSEFLNSIKADLGKYAVGGEMDDNIFNLIMNETDFIILNNEYRLIYNRDNIPIIISGLNINNLNYINVDNSNNYYHITLVHNYDYYSKYDTNANLVLAGHNLGGEIRLPFADGLLGNNQFNDNYYQINNNEVYISSGLGSIHKMRFFNHPSINVYRLYNN